MLKPAPLASPVNLMLVVSVASWLAALGIFGIRIGVDVLLGMIGPLVVTAGTWVLIERAHKRAPEQVTALMVGAFGGKMVFFGAYVAVMIRLVAVQPVPFVASFTSYFIALYLIEALYLRRLFAGPGSPDSPGGSSAPRAPGESRSPAKSDGCGNT
jgi:hypothetical protein